MSARDMSRRGTVGGGRARFQPRARGANRSFRGRGKRFSERLELLFEPKASL